MKAVGALKSKRGGRLLKSEEEYDICFKGIGNAYKVMPEGSSSLVCVGTALVQEQASDQFSIPIPVLESISTPVLKILMPTGPSTQRLHSFLCIHPLYLGISGSILK